MLHRRSIRSRSSVPNARLLAALISCLGWSLLGCAGGPSGAKYKPDTLPATMVAAHRANSKTIDLSRLASAVGNNELIDRGDVLDVTIAAGLSDKDVVPLTVRVREDGMADVPVVGQVAVAGLELEEAEAAISARCIERQLYRAPYVTVTSKKKRVNRVTVVGAVKEPGVYEIPKRTSDLLAALVSAGGLDEDAGTIVEIRNPMVDRSGRPIGPSNNPGPIANSEGDGVNAVGFSTAGTNATPAAGSMQTLKVDLIKATKEGTNQYVIHDGGVVMVEKRDPEPVHVLGLVRQPNRYEMPLGQDLRLLDALALAGGVSSPVANKVYVIRKRPNSSETAIVDLRISDAKQDEKHNLRLSPGDVVSVEQTPATVLIDALRVINFGLGASLPLPGVF